MHFRVEQIFQSLSHKLSRDALRHNYRVFLHSLVDRSNVDFSSKIDDCRLRPVANVNGLNVAV